MPTTTVFIRSMRFLGGHLVTYPLLHQLRKTFPEDVITVAGTDPVSEHYLDTPWVNRFARVDSLRDKLGIMRNSTRIFVLHWSSEQYAPLSLFCRVPMRVGFRGRRLTDCLWTQSSEKDDRVYLGAAYMTLLQTIRDFDLQTAASQAMHALALQASVRPRPCEVIFMPGGGAGTYKRWRLDAFLALIAPLRQLLGPQTRFAVITGPDERREDERLRAMDLPGVQIERDLPMADIARLALHARLIVANDCGPSHLAQHTGCPYVGIFHEPNPEWFWQRRQSRAVIPSNGNGEIQDVTPEQVLQSCREVLQH